MAMRALIFATFIQYLASSLGSKFEFSTPEAIPSPGFGSVTPGLTKPPSRYLSFQAPAAQNKNPCDRNNVNRGVADAHEACENECLAVRTTVRAIYKLYPEYITVGLLYDKCGWVTEGRCSYIAKAYFPICWCHTPNEYHGRRRAPLFICRLGIPITRKLANTGIGIKRCKSGLTRVGSSCATGVWGPGKKSDEVEERKEQKEHVEPELEEWISDSDSEPAEGSYLVTTVQTAGRKIKALLDTGSSVSFIHRSLAKNIIPMRTPVDLLGINAENVQILGKTTIHVQIRKGISVPVTGLVATGFQFGILLGNDFLLEHLAKIRIPEGTMELSNDRFKVTVAIRLEGFMGQILSIDTDPGKFTTPLMISGLFNGRETQILIDTGAGNTIIREGSVDPHSIRPLNQDFKQYTIDRTEVKYAGETEIELEIEGVKFRTTALVAQFHIIHPLVLGNSFNKQHVQLIDFEELSATFIFPGVESFVTPITVTKWVYQLFS